MVVCPFLLRDFGSTWLTDSQNNITKSVTREWYSDYDNYSCIWLTEGLGNFEEEGGIKSIPISLFLPLVILVTPEPL